MWANSDIKYPKALAAKLGRDDLEVRPRSWLKPNSVRGRRFSGVVVDHAAPFCSEAYAALSLLQFTAGVDVFTAKRRFLDQVADAFHQQLHTRVSSEQQMTDKQIRLDEGTMDIAIAQELKRRLEDNIAGLLHDYSVATNTTVRSIDLDTVSRLGDSPLYVVTVEVHL